MGFAALNPSYDLQLPSENEIRRDEVDQAGGVDLEIGLPVAVHVTQDAGVVGIARLHIDERVAKLAGDAGERAAADEAEALIVGPQFVGIDRRDVDLVALGVAEIRDVVGFLDGRGRNVAVVTRADLEGVGAESAGQRVLAAISKQQVVAGAAVERVVTAVAIQLIVVGAAEQHIVAQVAPQDVVAIAAGYVVVTPAAVDIVFAAIGKDRVTGVRTGDVVIAVVAKLDGHGRISLDARHPPVGRAGGEGGSWRDALDDEVRRYNFVIRQKDGSL
jgi:hypothetical protein